MTRAILSEGLIEKFIVGVFDAVLNNKKKALAKTKAADPELKRIVQNLEREQENLRKWVLSNRIDPISGELTTHRLD